MKMHFKSLALLFHIARCRRVAHETSTLFQEEDEMDFLITCIKCATAALNTFRYTWKSLKNETEVANHPADVVPNSDNPSDDDKWRRL